MWKQFTLQNCFDRKLILMVWKDHKWSLIFLSREMSGKTHVQNNYDKWVGKIKWGKVYLNRTFEKSRWGIIQLSINIVVKNIISWKRFFCSSKTLILNGFKRAQRGNVWMSIQIFSSPLFRVNDFTTQQLQHSEHGKKCGIYPSGVHPI